MFIEFFLIVPFYNPWKDFVSFPEGIKKNTAKKWEEKLE